MKPRIWEGLLGFFGFVVVFIGVCMGLARITLALVRLVGVR
jgi:hypothetical protein